MRNRVAEVMAAVFDLPVSEISSAMALGHSKNWDSLKQLNLIMALEEEFSVSFTDEEVSDMISFPLILEVISEKTRK